MSSSGSATKTPGLGLQADEQKLFGCAEMCTIDRGLELESMDSLCSLEIELLSNRKSAWYFIFTSLFSDSSSSSTTSLPRSCPIYGLLIRLFEEKWIWSHNFMFISIQMVGFNISWPKNLMGRDAVDLTKCLFSQLPIFTQFSIWYGPYHTFARKTWKTWNKLNLSLFLSSPCNIIAGVSLHSVLLLSILFVYFYLSLFRSQPNFYLEPARDKNMKSKLMIQWVTNWLTDESSLSFKMSH